MELAPDQFKLKEELARLSVAISVARNELETLEQSKKEAPKQYTPLTSREKELEQEIENLNKEIDRIKLENKGTKTDILSPSQFQLKKTLASLSLEITKTREVLEKMKKSRGKFLEQQKTETAEAIKNVYEESKDYLAKAFKSFKEILGFIKEVAYIREETEKTLKDHQKQVQEFDSLSEEFVKELNNRQVEISKQNKEIDRERDVIAREKDQLKKIANENNKTLKLIESRQQALKQALEVLKKKKYE